MTISQFFNFLQTLDSSTILEIRFVASVMLIWLCHKLYKYEGLRTYLIINLLVCNIEIIKVGFLTDIGFPLYLGDIAFVSIFLTLNITIELYGYDYAIKTLNHGILAYVIFIIFTITTIGVPISQATTLYLHQSNAPQNALHKISAIMLSEAIPIMLMSAIAYMFSGKINIVIFNILRNFSEGKFLGLLHLVSSGIGVVVDTIIFSSLTWILFIVNSQTFSGYDIISPVYSTSSIIRIIFTILSIPIFYYIKSESNSNKRK